MKIVTTTKRLGKDGRNQHSPRKILGQQLLVLEKFKVDQDLFDRVHYQLDRIRPNLLDEETYDVTELLGEDFVANLSDIERRLAVYCLQHLSREADSNLTDMSAYGPTKNFLWSGSDCQVG